MVQVKSIPIGRFVVFIGCIFCGGKDRYIVSFSYQNTDTQKEVCILLMN